MMLRNNLATRTNGNGSILQLLLLAKASLWTGTPNCGKNTINRNQIKIFGKLFGVRVTGSKKHWYPTAQDSNTSHTSHLLNGPKLIGGVKKQGKNATRRMTVLNKLFMKHITDLLATGEVSEKIVGRGLQVTHVKTSPDFAFVNVFWLGSGKTLSDDVALEEDLRQCSGILRHELSQLYLMGQVPRIHFVRDKMHSNSGEVNALLSKLELNESFGTDQKLKRDYQWQPIKSIDCETTNKAPSTDSATEDTSLPDSISNPWPEMRHDVLGLDHRSIMLKIHTKMRKSKRAWELHEQGRSISDDSLTSPPIGTDNSSSAIQTQTPDDIKFNKFLHIRQFAKNTPERKKFNKDAHLLPSAEADAELEDLHEEEDYFHEDDNEKR